MGGVYTVTTSSTVSLHPAVDVISKVTVYVPAVVYACVGFVWFELACPSPKFQSHLFIGSLAVAATEASVNVDVAFKHTAVAVKLATGGGLTMACIVKEF